MSRIVICYAFDGSGHHAAALAIQAALREADPSCACVMLDFLRCLYPVAGQAVESVYLGVLKAAPFLWQILYDGRLAGSLAAGWATSGRRRVRGFHESVAQFNPQAVICTQASPFLLLSSVREVPFPPVFGVVTDFVPNRLWALRGKGAMIVPTPQAADRLMSLGVGAERLNVLGIPVNVKGLKPRGLTAEPRRRTVLVMGGGFGLHLSRETISQVDASPEPFSLTVIAGRNRLFREGLERDRPSFRHPLTVLGFVDDVPARLRAADVLVTKPGGMTSAEALALGVPMALLTPLPGQETYNWDFLIGSGAAVSAADGRAGEAVSRLLSDSSLAAGLRRRMAELARPHAARDIAQFVLTRTPASG